MSVSDIPQLFREEERVLLLFPSVAHGFLFHKTGSLLFLSLALISLIPAAHQFSIFYYHGIDNFFDYGGFMIERISIISTILLIPLVLCHLVAIGGLIWYMEYTDYIHVFLFLASVFLSVVVIFGLSISETAQQIHEIEEEK